MKKKLFEWMEDGDTVDIEYDFPAPKGFSERWSVMDMLGTEQRVYESLSTQVEELEECPHCHLYRHLLGHRCETAVALVRWPDNPQCWRWYFKKIFYPSRYSRPLRKF